MQYKQAAKTIAVKNIISLCLFAWVNPIVNNTASGVAMIPVFKRTCSQPAPISRVYSWAITLNKKNTRQPNTKRTQDLLNESGNIFLKVIRPTIKIAAIEILLIARKEKTRLTKKEI